MADSTENTESTEQSGKVGISEGADVYDSDGERWGRVEAVGAKYLTIAEGLLGQRAYYLPIALVACRDADRVELMVSVEEAKTQAWDEEPADEPIYAHTEAIPIARRSASATRSRSSHRPAPDPVRSACTVPIMTTKSDGGI